MRMENNVDCSWKTDGSVDDCQVVVSKTSNGANNIEIDASAVRSPVNLMAERKDDDNLLLPESYWFTVEIVDLGGDNNNNSSNSISVGVVFTDEFKPGYKIKGMFYNGNLTNGRAGLSIGYGPYLKSGDICVLECATATTIATTDDDTNTSGGTFSMTIYVNGIKIGKGFEIEIPKNNDTTTHQSKRFSPCVHVNGKAKITTKITTEKPPNLLLPQVGQQQQHPLDGDWVIVEMNAASGMEQVLPIKEENNNNNNGRAVGGRRGKEIVVSMNLDVDNVNCLSLSISVKVANSIRIGKGFKPRPDDDDGMIYDLTSMGEGPPMMTRMMAFPPYNKVENEISSALEEGWKSIKFLPDGDEDELKIFGNDDDVVLARCVRKKNDDNAALTSY
jgi:hypothetical protein